MALYLQQRFCSNDSRGKNPNGKLETKQNATRLNIKNTLRITEYSSLKINPEYLFRIKTNQTLNSNKKLTGDYNYINNQSLHLNTSVDFVLMPRNVVPLRMFLMVTDILI